MADDDRIKYLEDELECLGPSQCGMIPDKATMNASLAWIFAKHLSPTAKAKIVKELRHSTNHFENPDVPGHANWYPNHLSIELYARKLIRDASK